jgi:hypothetical protein
MRVSEEELMKGVVPICLGELIAKRFGEDKWQQILETAGLPKTAVFMPHQNVDDAAVLKVLKATCAVLGITPIAAAEAFGEYWCCTYAPRIYSAFYGGSHNAKDFLLRMKDVHAMVTRTVPGAHPPVFTYEQPAPNRLVMHYASDRNLAGIFAGLVKGVGRYFHEELQIKKVGSSAVEITFAT